MVKLLFVIIAVLGYITNIKGNLKLSYYLWISSNLFWMVYNAYIKEYQIAGMFVIYNIFCVYGIITLNKKKK